MAKGKPTTSALNLFDFDALPELDNATLVAAGAEPLLDEMPMEHYGQLDAQMQEANERIAEKLGFDPFVEGEKLRNLAERSRALREDLVFPVAEETKVCPYGCCEGGVCPEWPCNKTEQTTSATQPGFWANKLKEMGEMRLLAARSFIEIARRSGIEHDAVKPTGTDSNGQKTYDMGAVTRLANLMRGKPESLKPELKTEADWQAAIEGLKAWKEGGKQC